MQGAKGEMIDPSSRGRARPTDLVHGTRRGLAVALMFCSALPVAGGLASAQERKRAPSSPGAVVYFVDIKDGARVPEKVVIRFGLRNMGVAPAGMEKVGTGHHHLLIDVPAPSADRPLPNDHQHLHFGSAQTEAEVTLPPGRHTLQLVLADHDHVPHDPPVMSDRINVTVEEAAGDRTAETSAESRKAAPANAKVYFVYPGEGDFIYPTSTIRFGLTGMGVAPAGVIKGGTGHHHLLVNAPNLPSVDQPIPTTHQHLHFGAGQTEVKLTLPPGEHTLQLVLGDANHVPHDPPIMSEKIKVTVRPGGPNARR